MGCRAITQVAAVRRLPPAPQSGGRSWLLRRSSIDPAPKERPNAIFASAVGCAGPGRGRKVLQVVKCRRPGAHNALQACLKRKLRSRACGDNLGSRWVLWPNSAARTQEEGKARVHCNRNIWVICTVLRALSGDYPQCLPLAPLSCCDRLCLGTLYPLLCVC